MTTTWSNSGQHALCVCVCARVCDCQEASKLAELVVSTHQHNWFHLHQWGIPMGTDTGNCLLCSHSDLQSTKRCFPNTHPHLDTHQSTQHWMTSDRKSKESCSLTAYTKFFRVSGASVFPGPYTVSPVHVRRSHFNHAHSLQSSSGWAGFLLAPSTHLDFIIIVMDLYSTVGFMWSYNSHSDHPFSTHAYTLQGCRS